MSPRHSDMRERIPRVALQLFVEWGYDRTSLQDIADALGVTKAAVYYHFKAKREILTSIFAAIVSDVDDLVAWSRSGPPSLQRRQETLVRLADLVRDRLQPAFRLLQENQPALRDLDEPGKAIANRMTAVFTLLAEPDAPLVDQLRSRLAVLAIYTGNIQFLGPLDATPDEVAEASLKIAGELIVPSSERRT